MREEILFEDLFWEDYSFDDDQLLSDFLNNHEN